MSRLDHLKSKIYTSVELIDKQLNIWRFQGKKIVFTNGCFDLLHFGHVDYLSEAADLGDILIVGLNTDDSVKMLKGPKRPVNGQESRSFMLASLSFVSAVILFEEETPIKLIKFIKPDVLVKGSDYKPEEMVGYDFVTSYNGTVKAIDLIPGYSTTNILQKIIESR
jgi:D-glycero-beta-D-manno-heptose 1-phosphate adenylyltransferase